MKTTGSIRPILALLAGLILSLPGADSRAAGAVPSSVSAEARQGYILVAWTAPADAPAPQGYLVYRSLSAGGPYTLVCRVGPGDPLSCRDTAVANNTRYFYVVRALGGDSREGPSSSEASTVADTYAPSAFMWAELHGTHYSGRGPAALEGKAIDPVSGIEAVRVAIRRNDTQEWWSGSSWSAAAGPVYLTAKAEGNGTQKWRYDTSGVSWSQATSYYIRVSVRDKAGFELDPSDSTTIFIDTPARLALSVAAAPAVVTAGQVVIVTVLVANTGGTPSGQISVLPPSGEGTATVAVLGESRVNRVQSLAPGEFATMTWSYVAANPGVAGFRAEVSGVDALNGGKVSAVSSLSNEVHVRSPARLGVEMSPLPANIRQGSPVSVRMLVTNAGENDAIVTELTVMPSPERSLAEVSGPEPVLPATLKAGDSREFSWNARAMAAGEIKMTGVAHGYDETSGKPAVSAPHTTEKIGVAGAPATLELVASTDSVIVSSKVAVTARVRDSAGIPVPGVAVSFRDMSGGGSVRPGLVVTDEFGRARATLSAGGKSGINTVEGRVGALLGAVSVEGVAPGGTGQYLSRSFFDPTREPLEIKVPMERAGRISISVRNTAGDPVAQVVDRKVSAGQGVYRWDGRNSAGAPVPNGVYFIFIQAGESTVSRRVSVLAR